ncbi:hypothetical protein [Haliangium ochraceum]|uniref:Tetratricopeptide TPR_4 n=1 Tax=Haliangium ochraceum (strain DSM 14365 / JCM 11303 / SMP-2) TaxID=502025 RepID=D0LJK4_HALO1|nr:hypothetical protein [Haliangium ochraceum]ACY16578.1 Tetratricopeptide TPR_4 [Haliangium ochraceum DSM 14365]
MLTRGARAGALGLGVLGLSVALPGAGAARAQDADEAAERAVHEPVRLTAGGSNQWMGILHPARDALYFVSDRNATAEIFVQEPVDSGPRLLFESNADVSWPQPSPDGTHLAYISTQADAAGDLCVRALPAGEARVGEERCFTGLGSSEMQPLWLDGGRSLGVLTRGGLHDDYRLRRFSLNGGPKSGELVVERNMLGVAASPRGAWLAYVPLARTVEQVGIAFANASQGGLALLRPARPQAQPVRFTPERPGLTEFPAFSLDGGYLYFAQYLNDSNGDGRVDGNDNSVLFRVPFDAAAAVPVRASAAEQLTSAQWNCRYPMPAAERLIVTCAHQGSLDIYALPLTGAVPASWDAARLRDEIHAARDHYTKLLLLDKLRAALPAPAQRIEVLRQVVWLHLELREFRSAIYYADEVRALAETLPEQGAAARWAGVMRELAEHRRADVRLTHGQLSDEYLRSEEQRLARLAAPAAAQAAAGAGAGAGVTNGDVAALLALVRSEIQDDIGRVSEGERSFAEVTLAAVGDALVLEVYAQRAREVLGLRGARAELLGAYRGLAEHPALGTLERLRFAEAFVEELARGVPHGERRARIDAWIEQLDPASEIALTIEVAAWLLQLSPENQEEVRAGIFALYRANKDPDRRRALVLATVRTAAREGNDYLQYQFSNSWTSGLRRAAAERKYAEDLFRQVVLERAYTQLERGEVAEARASFYAATVQTESLEGHIGFIEARLREGQRDLEELYAERFEKTPSSPAYAFVRAYLLARALPGQSAPAAHERDAKQAIALLRQAAQSWPRSLEIQHVWGTVLHQRALRSGRKQHAIDAHSHYMLALDLARDNPRFRAALLQQLGLLQASLGNHRIALQHFADRARLPFVRPAGELNLRLAMARSYFHANLPEAAVSAAQEALSLAERELELARYRPLILDRLALYTQAAGGHVRAFELYENLLAMSAADAGRGQGDGGEGGPLARVKLHLGAAGAALSATRYREALGHLDEIDRLVPSLPARPVARVGNDIGRPAFGFDRVDYAILAAGLRAQAHRALGELAPASRAMGERQRLLAARFADTDTDEDLLALAHCAYHLGEYAYRAGALDEARAHFERGLGHVAAFNRRTGSGASEAGLRLVQAYAELHLYGGVPLSQYQRDLGAELRQAYEFICEHRNPSWDRDRFLFSLYLTMLALAA